MFPILVAPDITTYLGIRRSGAYFEGVVSALQRPNSSRLQHVCLGGRDTEAEALGDAERDANALLALWRQKVSIPGGRRRRGGDPSSEPSSRGLVGGAVNNLAGSSDATSAVTCPAARRIMAKSSCCGYFLAKTSSSLPNLP